jgi:hypothetical protein
MGRLIKKIDAFAKRPSDSADMRNILIWTDYFTLTGRSSGMKFVEKLYK